MSVTPLSQVALSAHAAYSTPEPLGPSAAPELFAEGRALRTVRRLTSEVGLRRVRPWGSLNLNLTKPILFSRRLTSDVSLWRVRA